MQLWRISAEAGNSHLLIRLSLLVWGILGIGLRFRWAPHPPGSGKDGLIT